jgi:glycosyltransferase involved in cell wall biosynthesis
MTPAAFAIPGDMTRRTGGFIYERRLLAALRAEGREVRHLRLPAGFPDPTDAEMRQALAILGDVPPGVPVILDGFVSGTLDPDGAAAIRAPLCAMVHHPLGHEEGLAPDRAAFLVRREVEALKRMAHVLVPSPHTARTLVTEFAVPEARVTVAPPGFDPALVPPAPVRPPLILSVGIVHPRKGHDVLIEALAGLRHLDWNAVIVGGVYHGPHAAMLTDRVAAHGLGGRIRFAGEVEQAALDAHYAAATVFALATRYEGYGMVFGEALRRGLPIVSCRAGAVPDTVPEEAGLLVPPDDPAAFAAALGAMLSDDVLRARLAQGAATAGAALPTWADTARIAGRVLDDLAGAAPTAAAARP